MPSVTSAPPAPSGLVHSCFAHLPEAEPEQEAGAPAIVTELGLELSSLEEAQTAADYLGRLSPNPELASLGIAELLINAIEHGNLEIGFERKTELLRSGGWLEEIERRLALPEYRERRVRVRVRRAPHGLSVEVADDGAGFDFQRFLDRSRDAGADAINGRGIALCRDLVFTELAYHEPGNRVEATLRFQTRGRDAVPTARTLLEAPDASGRRTRVLVVDDSPTDRRILEVSLHKLGYDTLALGSAEEALSLLAHTRPDLALIDVGLPGLGGLELVRSLRAGRYGAVPILVISGGRETSDALEALRAGADDYLSKPISPEILEAKLHAVARLHALEHRLTRTVALAQRIGEDFVDGIITIDGAGGIHYANPAARRVFGYDDDAALPPVISKLIPCGKSAGVGLPWCRCSAGTEDAVRYQAVTLTGRRRDGSFFPLEAGVFSVRLGEERLYVLSFRDVTAQRHETARLVEYAERLQGYTMAREWDDLLAQEVFDKLRRRESADIDRVDFTVEAMDSFSGDAVAFARAPNGRLFAMLADATGHGLGAAISLLPVLSVFYAMVKRGRSFSSIVVEMNDKLHQSLPVGRFIAAILVCVDETTGRGEIWVGGMPEALWLDRSGAVARRFRANHPALGVIESTAEFAATEEFSWSEPGQLVLYSDGVTDAEDGEGRAFGSEALEASLRNAPENERMSAVRSALRAHRKGTKPNDDAAVALVTLTAPRSPARSSRAPGAATDIDLANEAP